MDVNRLDFLDTKSALVNMGGSVQIYESIVTEYVKMHDEVVEELRKAFIQKNYEIYIIKAHALKGTSATVGAVEMSAHAKQHEFAGKEGRYDYIAEDIENLICEYDELVSRIAKELGIDIETKKTNIDTTSATAGDYEAAITEVISLLEDFEVDVATAKLNNILKLQLDEQLKAVIEEAIAMIEDFEYDAAATHLKKIV